MDSLSAYLWPFILQFAPDHHFELPQPSFALRAPFYFYEASADSPLLPNSLIRPHPMLYHKTHPTPQPILPSREKYKLWMQKKESSPGWELSLGVGGEGSSSILGSAPILLLPRGGKGNLGYNKQKRKWIRWNKTYSNASPQAACFGGLGRGSAQLLHFFFVEATVPSGHKKLT